MKKILLYLGMLLLAQTAFSQTVTLQVKVCQDDPWVWPEEDIVTVEGATVTISNADVLPGGLTATSDADGIASFEIDQPAAGTSVAYEFEISKAGYQTAIGLASDWTAIFVYDWTDFSTPVKKAILKDYNVTFTVTDESDNAIEGATISMLTEKPVIEDKLTDANGQATFVRNKNWQHEYTVSAAGYADTTSTFEVVANGADMDIPTIKMKQAYSVTMTLVDGSANPIENALVRLTGGGVTLEETSDATGQVVFESRVNGEYSYVITGTGVIDHYGSLIVADADPNTTVTLETGYDLTITVINGETGDIGLEGNSITIDDKTKETGVDGTVTFGVEPGSSYSFDIVQPGFTSVPFEVNDIQDHTNITVYMKPEYTVIFNITSVVDYSAVEGATVSINGTEYVTGADGVITLTDLEPSATPYDFTVAGPDGEGFFEFTGAVDLPLSSTSYMWDNNVKQQYVTLEKPYAFVSIDNGGMPYYALATVIFDGVEYPYEGIWGGNRFYVAPGTYSVVVITGDENNAIIRGSVTVTETENGMFLSPLVPGYTVDIYAVDQNQDPVVGAEVSFNQEVLTTDDTGLAQFIRVAGADYTYSITAAGYVDLVDVAITVATEDVMEIATLNQPEYDVTFTITDGTNPIEGAVVTVGEATATSDASGIAVVSMINGTYSYTATAAGYEDASGSVTVADAAVAESVSMIQLTYDVTFTVTDGTDPIAGAVVTVGSESATADASGVAVIADLVNGNYDYTVTATGYVDVTGSVTVADADAAEAITMSLLSYSVTFTVTDGTDPIDGATVTIEDASATTDASGVAVITGLVNGAYDYTVTATGYVDATGSVTVADADLAESVSMSMIEYSITFTVTDGSDAIEGATVTVGEESASTDASGVAVINGLVNGAYNYTVTATDYDDASGTVTVADADATEDVTMTLSVGFEVFNEIEFNAYPNPTSGLIHVEINNAEVNTVNVMDMMGRVIEQVEVSEGSETVRIDLSGYAQGIYVIQVTQDELSSSLRIMKN